MSFEEFTGLYDAIYDAFSAIESWKSSVNSLERASMIPVITPLLVKRTLAATYPIGRYASSIQWPPSPPGAAYGTKNVTSGGTTSVGTRTYSPNGIPPHGSLWYTPSPQYQVSSTGWGDYPDPEERAMWYLRFGLLCDPNLGDYVKLKCHTSETVFYTLNEETNLKYFKDYEVEVQQKDDEKV